MGNPVELSRQTLLSLALDITSSEVLLLLVQPLKYVCVSSQTTTLNDLLRYIDLFALSVSLQTQALKGYDF